MKRNAKENKIDIISKGTEKNTQPKKRSMAVTQRLLPLKTSNETKKLPDKNTSVNTGLDTFKTFIKNELEKQTNKIKDLSQQINAKNENSINLSALIKKFDKVTEKATVTGSTEVNKELKELKDLYKKFKDAIESNLKRIQESVESANAAKKISEGLMKKLNLLETSMETRLTKMGKQIAENNELILTINKKNELIKVPLNEVNASNTNANDDIFKHLTSVVDFDNKDKI